MQLRPLAGLLPALLVLAARGAAQAPTAADSVRVLRAERAQAPVRVDGVLGEAEWEGSEEATGFVQYRPAPGAAASQQTRVRVRFDGAALYVGARLLDTAPDSIVARLARRDEQVISDWFYVSIDSQNDRRTAFSFMVNPRGVQRDYLLYEDTRVNNNWDAVWASAARMDSLGWTVEMRIPLSQLRFTLPAERDAEFSWGVNFGRIVARHEETATWAPLSPNEERQVSRFGRLAGMRGVRPPRRLELSPYTVAGVTRAPGSSADPFYHRTDPELSAGGDMEYGLTNDLTLSATINPDFGQVEADPSVVNLTVFETFFPEKRPFFVEGAQVFEVDGPSLFYSRRIGRQPQATVPRGSVYASEPERTTILGAAKVTGRTAGGWTIGALDAVTLREEGAFVDTAGRRGSVPVEPLTNYAVARARREFGRGQTGVGAIVTATNRPGLPGRLEFLHSAAYAGGVDARHRFGGGNYEVEGTLLGSHVRGSREALQRTQLASTRYLDRPGAGHLRYDSTRTSLSGWAFDGGVRRLRGRWRWSLTGAAYSPGFEVNDLGFLSHVDEAETQARVTYDRFTPTGRWRRHSVSLLQGSEWSFGGERTRTIFVGDWTGQLRSYWTLFAVARHNLGVLSTTGLRGGPALRVSPRDFLYGGFESDSRGRLWYGAAASYERERGTGGRFIAANALLSLKPTSGVELRLEPRLAIDTDPSQYVALRGVGEEDVYVFGRIDRRTVSLTTRFNYAMRPDLSLQVYAQPYVSAGRYDRFARVARPGSGDFAERVVPFGGALSFDAEDNRYGVDLDGSGREDLSFGNPDFNFKQLRSTAVLRWEYRPGSTLFAVWNRGQSARDARGRFDLFRDLGDLAGVEGRDTLLVKFVYWFGL